MKSNVPILVVLLALGPTAFAGVDNNPQKEYIFEHLKRLTLQRPKDEVSHFFVLKRKDGEWIYWREGRLLWRTELEPFCETKGKTEITAKAVWELRFSLHKAIQLDTDVVPTAKDVHGSSVLVPKDYAANIIYECVLDGEIVEVRKPSELLPLGFQITVQKPSSGIAR